MNTRANEFLRTDFGHEVYDEWYLEQGSYNFETPEFVKGTSLSMKRHCYYLKMTKY